MARDPYRRMTQLTRQVDDDRRRLTHAWQQPDPTVADLPARPPGTRGQAGPSDPVANTITIATGTRLAIIAALVGTTRQVAELAEALGHPLPATAVTLDQLEQQPSGDRPTGNAVLQALLAVHVGCWQIVHDHVQAADYDHAADIIDLLDRRVEHRLAHQLRKIADRAETAIVQPDHPAATDGRIPCADRHGYGCTRFVHADRTGGACRSCENRARREREALAR